MNLFSSKTSGRSAQRETKLNPMVKQDNKYRNSLASGIVRAVRPRIFLYKTRRLHDKTFVFDKLR